MIGIGAGLARPAWAWALLGVTATAVMAPRLLSPHFGLLDDGLVPLVASSKLPAVLWQFDRDSGRFRPLYWLGLVTQYRLWGPSPLAFFLALYAMLVATAVLICESIALAARDRLAGLLAGLAFLLAPPVIENYYTASKSEPRLVLLLALSVYFLFRALDVADRDAPESRRWLGAAALCALAAYFWKETAHAMLIVGGLWLAGAWYRDHRLSARPSRIVLGYFLANVACAAIFRAAYAMSGTSAIGSGTYSAYYILTLDMMAKSALKHLAFAVRDFPLFLIAAVVWAAHAARERPGSSPRTRWIAFDCLAWIVGWTAVMLPWRATFEYYLLPLAVGVSMLTGPVLTSILRAGTELCQPLGWVSKATLAVGVGLTIVVLINNATNGRLQLAVDASDAKLIDFLAAEAPAHGTVLLNLPAASEYLGELRDHLGRLHGRPDLRIGDLRGARDVAGALVVNPIMRHQPTPTVRLGFAERDAPSRAAELEKRAAHRTTVVYRQLHEMPVFYVALEKVVCPLLLAADVRDGLSCGVPWVIDRRTFQYGWEVYAFEQAVSQAR